MLASAPVQAYWAAVDRECRRALLFSEPPDPSAWFWEPSTERLERMEIEVTVVALSPDGRLAALGWDLGRVELRDLETGEMRKLNQRPRF